MADDNDPPRKFYALKPREFERANEVRAEERPPSPVPAPSPISPSQPIDLHALIRDATIPGPVLRTTASIPGRNEIHGILDENLQAANRAGLNEVPLGPRKRSRRKRDYFLLMMVVNIALAVVAAYAVKAANPFLFVYTIAGMGLFSAGVTWVMWMVMDDY